MVTCCPQGVLASGHSAEACWLPTGSADGEALQEFPGAGGLQHAADGARAGPAGEHERRRHPPGERPRPHSSPASRAGLLDPFCSRMQVHGVLVYGRFGLQRGARDESWSMELHADGS